MTSPRPLDPNERALLDGFLALDFDGVAALRDQTRGVGAAPGCTCGCGSLDLFPDGTSPRSTAAIPIPSEGGIRDDAGEEVGGLLLFLDAGRLSYMEVYSYFDPLPLPSADNVHWTAAQRGQVPLSAPAAPDRTMAVPASASATVLPERAETPPGGRPRADPPPGATSLPQLGEVASGPADGSRLDLWMHGGPPDLSEVVLPLVAVDRLDAGHQVRQAGCRHPSMRTDVTVPQRISSYSFERPISRAVAASVGVRNKLPQTWETWHGGPFP